MVEQKFVMNNYTYDSPSLQSLKSNINISSKGLQKTL